MIEKSRHVKGVLEEELRSLGFAIEQNLPRQGE